VCILTAMPSAKGLFHKAVVLSGASRRSGDKTFSEKLGAAVVKEAGLSSGELDKLQSMPWKDFLAVATRAQAAAAKEAGPGGGLMRGFSPVVDGKILPQHPYDPVGAPTAADVPMIISSVQDEQSPSWSDSSLEAVTLEQVAERVKVRAGFGPGFGDKAKDVVEAYAKAFPGKKPVEIWSLVSANRQSVVALADAKSKQPAPVYVDWFTWQPPLFDNRMRAFHCVDICFWFYNTDLMLTHTGGGARPRALAKKMAGTLLQFMKTGNPNGAGLPKWPKYTSANGETMVFDDVSVARNDPDREARKALPAVG
jgi:para-nitrobenzyl esterase